MTKHILTKGMRENAIYRYVRALDNGDLESISHVLELALDDAELDRILIEINRAYEEENIGILSGDAEFVRMLLNKHFPENIGYGSNLITVGHVASALQKKQTISSNDQAAHRILIKSSMELPKGLNINEVKKLAATIGASASESYWRAFRNVAITMSMGQGTDHESELAAARESKKQNKHE